MKIVVYLLTFCVLLSGCADSESRAHDAVDEYLKRKGIRVEQLKMTSVKPVDKTQFTKLMTKLLLKDREQLKIALPPDGEISDSLRQVIINKRELDRMYANRVAEVRAMLVNKRDRDDFAFFVEAECTYSVVKRDPQHMELKFLFCRHKDIGLVFVDGPKWVFQRGFR